MSTACDLAAQSMGTGVSAAPEARWTASPAVSAKQAFNRLFGTEGTIDLRVDADARSFMSAFFAISLIARPVEIWVCARCCPKVITLGLVMGFATSFRGFFRRSSTTFSSAGRIRLRAS